jgi:hypothetical protein
VECLGRHSWGLTSDSSWLGRFLGTMLVAKGSPQGTQLSPKSDLNPWNKSGDRSRWRLGFPAGRVLTDCLGKTGLTVSVFKPLDLYGRYPQQGRRWGSSWSGTRRYARGHKTRDLYRFG